MAQKGLGSIFVVVVGLDFFIGQDAWPCLLSGGSQDAKDEMQLLFHCGAWEEGLSGSHLIEDAVTPQMTIWVE